MKWCVVAIVAVLFCCISQGGGCHEEEKSLLPTIKMEAILRARQQLSTMTHHLDALLKTLHADPFTGHQVADVICDRTTLEIRLFCNYVYPPFRDHLAVHAQHVIDKTIGTKSLSEIGMQAMDVLLGKDDSQVFHQP